MTRTLTINSRELTDLQLIVKGYETKIAKQSKGEKVALLAYRPTENIEASFRQTYVGLDPEDSIGKGFNKVKRTFKDANEGFTDATVGKITEGFANIYKTASLADRENEFEVGPLKVQSENTIIGMANAFKEGDIGKGFSVLMNDCIPCNLRFDAIRLLPDISFLEQILNISTKFVEETALFIKDLFLPQNLQGDICAHLNLFNFTCVPDFKALFILLQKGITINLSFPKFKLPGLGDLFSIIVGPILASFASVANAWMPVIIGPVDCLIRSLRTIIRKYKVPPGNTAASIKTNETQKEYQLKASASVGVDAKLAKEINKATGTDPSPVLLALDKLVKFLIVTRNKIANAFQKIVRKYTASLNQGTKSLFNLITGAQEVLKIVSILRLVTLLQNIFNSKLTYCSDKPELLKKVYEDTMNRMNDVIPGKARIESPEGSDNVRVSKSVNLTPDEIEALGLQDAGKENVSIVNETIDKKDTENPTGSEVKVTAVRNIEVGDCSVISNREQFVSVDRLIQSF